MSAARPASRSNGADDGAWRRRLPRVLIALVLLALALSLLAVQRSAVEGERRLEAASTEAISGETSGAALAGTPGGDGAGTFRHSPLSVDGLLARAGVLGVKPSRLALVALALVALLVGLLVWLALDSSRRREHRDRVDDGRSRREQAAILSLLDEITPLASGDLRVRATVTEAMTGALADAFNHAVAELRWLVGTIDASSRKVGEAVELSREAAQRSVGACTVQAREIHRSSNYLSAMSETMSQLSAHAAESSRIASVSVDEAEAGGRAIRESVARLSSIRDEAELATALMQRLADNATAIDERVETIRDVARRTDLLALNTTIRAAASAASALTEADATDRADAMAGVRGRDRAGERVGERDGRGGGPRDEARRGGGSASGDLSRLSDEVTQLADLLGGAARDIASLSRTIRQDAEDTVQAMDETNRELAAGFAQAEQASGSLESIESVSRELQGLVHEMAEKALRQSGVVRQLSTNMGAINRITSETSRDVQTTAGTLDALNDMALELRDGIADFRLPKPSRPGGQGSQGGQGNSNGSDASSSPVAGDDTEPSPAAESSVAREAARAARRSSARALDHG